MLDGDDAPHDQLVADIVQCGLCVTNV